RPQLRGLCGGRGSEMSANEKQRLPLPLNDDKSPPTTPPPELPPDAGLEERVIAALHTCYDPEIPIDIYELGLIYDLKVEPSGAVYVRMTLTSPACPVAGALPGEVEAKIRSVPGVTDAKVELVW